MSNYALGPLECEFDLGFILMHFERVKEPY